MTINRELFEAWLFSQPRERLMDYKQGSPDSEPGCALCNFERETIKRNVIFGGCRFWTANSYGEDATSYPNWIMDLKMDSIQPFTIGNLQARYLTLFPNTLDSNQSQTEAPSAPVAKGLETPLNQVVSSQKCD